MKIEILCCQRALEKGGGMSHFELNGTAAHNRASVAEREPIAGISPSSETAGMPMLSLSTLTGQGIAA
jgi:hypothetical protein